MRPVLRIVSFVTLSAVVGLAAAFIAVMIRPELIARRVPAPPSAPPAAAPRPAPAITPPAPAPVIATPERAAPAVVNIYTARLVTERIQPNAIEELFGDARPRFRQRLEQSLGSGVIV